MPGVNSLPAHKLPATCVGEECRTGKARLSLGGHGRRGGEQSGGTRLGRSAGLGGEAARQQGRSREEREEEGRGRKRRGGEQERGGRGPRDGCSLRGVEAQRPEHWRRGNASATNHTCSAQLNCSTKQPSHSQQINSGDSLCMYVCTLDSHVWHHHSVLVGVPSTSSLGRGEAASTAAADIAQ